MNDNINIIKSFFYKYLIVCSILEIIFHPEMKNFVGCIVFIYGWWLVEKYVFKIENIVNFCIPTIIVIGYVIMYFILPIGVTLIECKPVTFKFENPYLTWYNLFLNITTIILAYHFAYNKNKKNNYLQHILNKMGYYNIPNHCQIWLLGGVGMCALIYNISTQQNDFTFDEMQEFATGGALENFISKLEIYSIVPLCLLFNKYYGDSKVQENRKIIYIYLSFIFIIAISTTRRSLIAFPILSIIIIALLFAIIEGKKLLTKKRTIILVCIIYVVTGPMVDLFMAMALNRHNKDSETLFSDIIELYNDKEKLHSMKELLSAFRGKDETNSSTWSEYYVDNILLDRFCNLRVQDATLFYANSLGYDNEKMHKFAKDFVVFRVPTFITNIIGEQKVVRTSPGDLFVEEYFHEVNHIGQKVAGDTGIGLYWMGYSYYIFAFFIYFLFFYVLASLSFVRNGQLILPIFIMSSFASYFMYLVNAIGIFSSIDFLIRTGWQQIIIYCIFINSTKFVLK